MSVTARLSDGTTITGQLDWWTDGRASIDGITYEQVRFIEVTR